MWFVYTVFTVLSLAALTVRCDDLDWWKTATFYQIYPRSYKDTNGDGIGDLQGIKEKAQYIADLGVSAVWLSPIFSSPQKDFGYDISNYTTVDPVYGTNQDLLDLIAELKALGVKLILDYVPNHTSDEHDWFIKSVAGDVKYKDFYVWKNKSGDDPTTKQPLPPNNWQSIFSGSAWQWNEQRQQFYLHQFVVGQPDLNYNNPDVVEAMTNNIIFWMEQGADGFRCDAVGSIFEDDQFQNEPLIDPSKELSYGNLNHIYTQNQPKTYELLANWSNVIGATSTKENRSRIMFLEVYADVATASKYYVGPNFAMPFNFVLLSALNQNKNAPEIAQVINDWRTNIPDGAFTSWVVGNHDNRRITNRMGVDFVDAINIMLALLPGIMVTYNGEELGMEDTFVRWDQTKDPSGLLLGESGYLSATRDPERTPIQWDSSENAGFTNISEPWLPINPNYWRLNVQAQQDAVKSHLKVYQRMAAAKKTNTLKSGSFQLTVPNNDTMIIERRLDGDSTYIGIINWGSVLIKPDLSVLITNETSFVVYTSSIGSSFDNDDIVTRKDSLVLRPKAAVVLRTITSGASTVVSLVSTLFLTVLVLLRQI